jgi:hypothetical protein
MSVLDFNKLNPDEKKLIFTTAGEKAGLPAYAVEKDWWVVQTLRIIFEMEIGNHLLFKGGTSLSKAWKLINRFSEDIDLALNREYLGFDSGLISKTQVKKLREASFEYLTKSFNQNLQNAYQEQGFTGVTFEYEHLGDGDQDPVSILVYYPQIIDYPDYIQPRVKVEIGSRSLTDPYTDRSFTTIISEEFSDKPYAETEITIPCINPERTYLEKLFLLHEEFQKPNDKIRVERLSRHLYDIHQIAKSVHQKKAHDHKLITDIIAHRKRFNGMKGVDYSTHFPPNLNSIPPDKCIEAWREDYKTMQEEMIPGDSPTFDEIIDSVKKELKEFNSLKIEKLDD